MCVTVGCACVAAGACVAAAADAGCETVCSEAAITSESESTMADNALQQIVTRKKAEIAQLMAQKPIGFLREQIVGMPPTRNFFAAVAKPVLAHKTRVIAEVKHKSPSAGVIRTNFDPVDIARRYHAAGAAAISCLTDEADFGGHLSFLQQIRNEVPLPVLRKDFIIDAWQIWQSRAAGADAILLIAECLTEQQIVDFQILAIELGMTTLLEVHDVENLYRCVPHIGFPDPAASLLGINNRNLRTMTSDLTHTLRLADLLEDKTNVVSESGIRTSEDLRRLRDHGVNIALVGEHLMKQDDPGDALRELLA